MLIEVWISGEKRYEWEYELAEQTGNFRQRYEARQKEIDWILGLLEQNVRPFLPDPDLKFFITFQSRMNEPSILHSA